MNRMKMRHPVHSKMQEQETFSIRPVKDMKDKRMRETLKGNVKTE